MEDFKFTVDVLSSAASLIAISTVLIAWYIEKQNPLLVKKILIHVKENEKVYNLYIKNRRGYPVTIKIVRCFIKKKFRVEKINSGSVELLTSFPIEGYIFESTNKTVIEPNGYTTVTYKTNNYIEDAQNYMFLIDSSHGHFETHCHNIHKVTFDTIVSGIETAKEFESKRLAYWFCFRLKIKQWFS
ncbi:hypothetical protein [Vibrio cholerae]|uniref:hypothetical protein n=1 Tax=Vibrio cholerae TaxID=666 RepID=UPI001561932E|nr:hypothetical protein [Vibrio cholerae]EGR0744088.1 hypothetical protein [Vibrio cholerae]EGR0757223.1 hypothetical protein [Vibrio cholerae]EGR0820954.1 hypothetical protein [Vibrio cholerae]EJF1759363.1 hypothetical protein [Vibrio cholerae]EJK2101735.1 hypothetical protein [Vibrio cholerae]